MRDTLEKQLLADAYFGDTTVLSETLGLLTDTQVFNALSDENQKQFNKPVEPVMVSMTIDELRNLFIAGSSFAEDFIDNAGDEAEMTKPDFGDYLMETKGINVELIK